MADVAKKERQTLGRVLLAYSALTGVLSIVYLIRFIFMDNEENGFIAACAFAATMLFGTFLSIGLNYTIRVPRGKDDDKSQVIAGAIIAILGTVICVSMQINMGVGSYWFLPVAYYIQSALIVIICLLSLKFYKR
ncbi:MAG: hypothetical protein MJ155_00170 [Candidatus Saccharibacteria bacterium]|nr:hypothetical protein [Candidatus Saccharibacteria bacterium]